MPDVCRLEALTGLESDTHRADRAIAKLAARQWGVLSRGQLLDAGLTPKIVRGRIERGQLLRLHRGVYAVGHRELRREGYWLAAVLAVPGAVLSHRDAAGLHGIRPANHRRVDVTTTRSVASHEGIAVHRTRTLDAKDIVTVTRIPATSVARTLVDLAGVVPRDQLAKAFREAEQARRLDVRAIERVLARTRTRHGPGHRATREALAELEALATTFTRSPLEDAFLKLVREAGLARPGTNTQVEGYEVDACWPDRRLVVELDGWEAHGTRHAFERDRARDAALAGAGWRVVRFTHRQVTERPEHVVEALRRLGL